jgi:c-di-GMP-binding flagellar brake protein YcgR
MMSPADRASPLARNTRRHRRHQHTSFAWFQTIEDGRGIQGLSHTLDMSLGGMRLMLNQPLEVGTLLMIEAVIGEMKLCAVCRVVHCGETENATYSLGLEFKVVSPCTQEILQKYFG